MFLFNAGDVQTINLVTDNAATDGRVINLVVNPGINRGGASTEPPRLISLVLPAIAGVTQANASSTNCTRDSTSNGSMHIPASSVSANMATLRLPNTSAASVARGQASGSGVTSSTLSSQENVAPGQFTE